MNRRLRTCKHFICSLRTDHHKPRFQTEAGIRTISMGQLTANTGKREVILWSAEMEFCKRSWEKHKKHYAMGLYPKADEHRFKYQCFKSAWMTTVLHEGFKFPRGYKGFQSAQFVKGKEIQWTLGAILYRTRFMPLREIQHINLRSGKVSEDFISMWLTLDHRAYFVVLFFCCFTVIAAVITYCRRVGRYSKTANLIVGPYEQKPSASYPQDIRVKV